MMMLITFFFVYMSCKNSLPFLIFSLWDRFAHLTALGHKPRGYSLLGLVSRLLFPLFPLFPSPNFPRPFDAGLFWSFFHWVIHRQMTISGTQFVFYNTSSANGSLLFKFPIGWNLFSFISSQLHFSGICCIVWNSLSYRATRWRMVNLLKFCQILRFPLCIIDKNLTNIKGDIRRPRRRMSPFIFDGFMFLQVRLSGGVDSSPA